MARFRQPSPGSFSSVVTFYEIVVTEVQTDCGLEAVELLAESISFVSLTTDLSYHGKVIRVGNYFVLEERKMRGNVSGHTQIYL
jgi:hypothetical protein